MIEESKPEKITLRTIVQWLIALVGGLLAFIGGQVVESLRGLHAEYGAMMHEVNEQDKTMMSIRTQVDDLSKAVDDVKSRIDNHIDTEAGMRKELREWKK